MEHEITAAVDLCDADGRLNREAVGWSRRPLHRANLKGFGRCKRWDYWAVVSDEGALQITSANLDYVGLVTVSFCPFAAPQEMIEKTVVRPFGRGLEHHDTMIFDSTFAARGLTLRMQDRGNKTLLSLATHALQAEIEVTRAHESMSVVVPWNERRFQLTCKDFALPANGFVRARGKEYRFDNASAALDWGRGIWPYKTRWNWACAAQGDRGLQFGGQWTDGTGATENALLVDGRIEKISERVVFDFNRRAPLRPWSIRGDNVQLQFTPIVQRPTVRLPIIGIGAQLTLCFGRFAGEAKGVVFEDALGWAEEMIVRW